MLTHHAPTSRAPGWILSRSPTATAACCTASAAATAHRTSKTAPPNPAGGPVPIADHIRDRRRISDGWPPRCADSPRPASDSETASNLPRTA
jgi:hypothetical protein